MPHFEYFVYKPASTQRYDVEAFFLFFLRFRSSLARSLSATVCPILSNQVRDWTQRRNARSKAKPLQVDPSTFNRSLDWDNTTSILKLHPNLSLKFDSRHPRLQNVDMDSFQHLADVHPPVCGLNVGKHFEGLTSKEKLYAHYMSRYVMLFISL